jgi:hypothetical protein
MIVPEHTSFPQPLNRETKVWRYLSLSKFLDFFLSDSLYFSRIDLLEDKHEGTYTKTTTGLNFDKVAIPSGQSLTREEYSKRLRQSMHVNCWRLDNSESEAMWKIYCQNNAGLAIQTTYEKLAESLPEGNKLHIGLITYLDYEADSFNRGNNLSPAMHKRLAFQHEKEIRIVSPTLNYMNDHNMPLPEPGIKVQTSLLEKIENIYVNPYADEWYFQTIKKLFDKLTISTSLKWSEIKSTIYY